MFFVTALGHASKEPEAGLLPWRRTRCIGLSNPHIKLSASGLSMAGTDFDAPAAKTSRNYEKNFYSDFVRPDGSIGLCLDPGPDLDRGRHPDLGRH